jgi:hypothetical protein
MTRPTTLTLALAFLVACGGDSPTAPEPPPVFPSIAGAYSGALVGTAPWQGQEAGSTINLEAAFAFSVSQTQGNLSGSYSLSGSALGCIPSLGCATDVLSGSGSFTGTVTESGTIRIDFEPLCGSTPSWTGTTLSGGSWEIRGTFTLYDACSVVAQFNSTILMQR